MNVLEFIILWLLGIISVNSGRVFWRWWRKRHDYQ